MLGERWVACARRATSLVGTNVSVLGQKPFTTRRVRPPVAIYGAPHTKRQVWESLRVELPPTAPVPCVALELQPQKRFGLFDMPG